MVNLEKDNCALWNEAVGQSSASPGCESPAKPSPALAAVPGNSCLTLGWKAPCSEPKGPVGGIMGGIPDTAGG